LRDTGIFINLTHIHVVDN